MLSQRASHHAHASGVGGLFPHVHSLPTRSTALPRVSTRPPRLRTQPRQTAPHTSDVNHKSRLPPVLPTSLLQIRGSQDSFLKFNNSLERLTEHRETVYLLDHGSITKETLYKSSQMERMRRTRYRGRAWSRPPGLHAFTDLGFLWRLHYIGVIDYIVGHW